MNYSKRYWKKRAISLIELIVVLLIISLVGSFAYMNLMPTVDDARMKTAKTQMKNFKMMLDKYKLDNGFYPTTAQGLQSLVEKPTTDPVPEHYQSGGYLNSKVLPKDPWGHDYVYEYPDPNSPDHFLMKSLGSDGKEGGEGNAKDIVLE